MHPRDMVALVIGMLICVAAGGFVLAYVARDARRDSREFWTPEGERLIADARRRGDEMWQRSGELRHRVTSAPSRAKGNNTSA
ncbi:MAG: hypothetical protein WBG57_13865 [Ornithinimicrobium sp.]